MGRWTFFNCSGLSGPRKVSWRNAIAHVSILKGCYLAAHEKKPPGGNCRGVDLAVVLWFCFLNYFYHKVRESRELKGCCNTLDWCAPESFLRDAVLFCPLYYAQCWRGQHEVRRVKVSWLERLIWRSVYPFDSRGSDGMCLTKFTISRDFKCFFVSSLTITRLRQSINCWEGKLGVL